MKSTTILSVAVAMIALSLPACRESKAEGHKAEGHKTERHKAEEHEEHQKLVVSTPLRMDVVVTQPFVCQIRAQRCTELSARAFGILEEVTVNEGQLVREGEVLFQVNPKLYQAKYEAEQQKYEAEQQKYEAEQQKYEVARLEYENTKRLSEQSVDGKGPVVSPRELAIYAAKQAEAKAKLGEAKAKLGEARANVARAETELNFAVVRAPFTGIIDRQMKQKGTTVKEGEILTTLSDTGVMWVEFNVPEAQYYEFKAREGKSRDPSRLELVDSRIELMLANGHAFDQKASNVITVRGKFNNETGNISFRADFPNPHFLLRHGQTGTILIHRNVRGALVIPQRAVFDILDKKFVNVVGHDHIVRQREIVVEKELEDIFVVRSGLEVHEQIILDGSRQVKEGDKLEYDTISAEKALAEVKTRAE